MQIYKIASDDYGAIAQEKVEHGASRADITVNRNEAPVLVATIQRHSLVVSTLIEVCGTGGKVG